MSWFDSLHPAVRHLIIALSAALLSALLANIDALPIAEGIKAIVGAMLPVLIAAVTPLSAQYGYGSTPKDDVVVEDVPAAEVGADEDH